MNKIYSPQKAFLYIAIVFGILTIVTTPLFQNPDEIWHFYRAYQVSTGDFVTVKHDQRLGVTIPKSLVKLGAEYYPFIANELNRISPKQLWQTRKIDLEPNDTIFTDLLNTALYSPLLYIPQAMGIFIGRQFGANPFWLVYFGRIFNLMLFIVLVYNAIKIIPFKKWLFVLLATLPMSITVNSSLSADVLLNSLSFLIIAIIFNLTYNEKIQQLSYKHILIILLLSVLIGFAKLVYVPILFLLFIIPSKKFKSTKVKIGIIAVAILAGSGTAYYQKSIIDSKYIPYSEYNALYRDYTPLNKGCDINKQIEFIKENRIHTIKVFIKSFFYEFKYMAKTYIGTFGCGHKYPPLWFVYLSYFFIFFISILSFDGPIPDLSLLQRSFMGLIVLVLVFLVLLSQYLSFDLVGENHAYPLTGRYLIPAFPIFLIMLSNVLKIKSGIPAYNFIIKGVFAFCIFSGVFNIYMILVKSYTLNDYKLSKWEVKYSFKENINNTNNIEYIISHHDTIAAFYKPTGSYITDEKTFTGTHSLKICNNNPYGFTLKIFSGMANDKLVVSCRSFGYCGYLDFQEYPNGINFAIVLTYPLKDSLGWKYQEAQFILPHDILKNNELRVFAWCPLPDPDAIYLDDFRVEYFDKK